MERIGRILYYRPHDNNKNGVMLPRLSKMRAWPTVSRTHNTHLLELSLILRIVVSVQHVNLDIVDNNIGKSDTSINKVLPSTPTSSVLSACIHQLAQSRKTLHKRDYVYWAKEGGNNPFWSLAMQLLLLSDDIHCNPGPVKNLCSVCKRPVAINHRLTIQWIRTRRPGHHLRVLVVTCRSLKSITKQTGFAELVELHKPDIIMGTESHLDNTIATSEVFPRDTLISSEMIETVMYS